MSSCRLDRGGLIDRGNALRVTFDGIDYPAYPGDTLASALLAQGIRVVGSGFKSRRPRGIVSAGSEEPNAFVDVGSGAAAEPNVRATQLRVWDGMVARSHRRSGIVDRVVGFIGHHLGPGFYYKTFMWPSWEFHERWIRRQAAAGTVPGAPDPRRYEAAFEYCDVLVIGAGRAGLLAAHEASRAGERTVVIEAGDGPGGRARWDVDAPGDEAFLRPAAPAPLPAHDGIVFLGNTTAVGYYDHNLVIAIEQGPGPERRQRLLRIRAGRVIIATGATERWLPFPGNDRPGVMLAGAVRRYAIDYGVACGERMVVLAAHDDGYRTARLLAAIGHPPAAVVDPRPTSEASSTFAAESGIEVMPGTVIVGVQGRDAVRAVDIASVAGGPTRRIACDGVAVAGGWNPSLALFAQSGGTLAFDRQLDAFVPGAALQPVTVVGAAAGRAGNTPIRRLLPRATAWQDTWVDLRHDVTASDIVIGAAEGYRSVEHCKRYTTFGMGADQGKLGNATSIAVLAAATGMTCDQVGTPTYRPPLEPVTLGALAAGHADSLYRPWRLLPAHAAHVDTTALFDEYGGWRRPACFPRAGETEGEAVSREVLAARTRGGVYDASSLGKIWVHGPDSAVFLNRIYATAVGSMPVGRVRYSFILDDAGVIIDDGVCARLGPQTFLLSPTSARADRVHAWLETWHQTEWPSLDLIIENTTACWATFSVVGPDARALLQGMESNIDFSAEGLPHMGMCTGIFLGVEARVARVSFTGETSFEISVPADRGIDIWRELVVRAGVAAIAPIGVEAVSTLRLEKGYIEVGTDTDVTTTPHDIGWGPLLDKRSDDFIGRRSLARPETRRDDRRQLVGLLAVDRVVVIPAGAHVVAPGVRRSLGFVTSSRWSPTVSGSIALALLEGGRSRHGQRVRLSDGVQDWVATVSAPVFVDPAGERLRG